MAKLSGAAGGATFDGTPVLITGWTVDITGGISDSTDSGDTTWKTFLASGYKEWSGTFEGFAIAGTEDAAIGGTAATLLLTAGATDTYTGSAILTGVSTTVDVPGEELVKKSYTFQGTGTLTQATS